MKRFLKKTGFIMVGIVIGILFSTSIVFVSAAQGTTLSNVLVGGIKIVVDGNELHPTDANGNTVEPMIYNGTTYLPVRAVATALGKAVYWDGPNYTVYLGNMDGELEYPTVMLTDMTNIGKKYRSSSLLTDNYGNRYSSAISNCVGYGSDEGISYEFLLKMQYSHFKGTLYVPSGETANSSVYFTVVADGKILYTSPEMTKTSTPVEFDVNVTGCNDITISFSDKARVETDLQLNLADAGFYQ